jgi:hypothetical protein
MNELLYRTVIVLCILFYSINSFCVEKYFITNNHIVTKIQKIKKFEFKLIFQLTTDLLKQLYGSHFFNLLTFKHFNL